MSSESKIAIVYYSKHHGNTLQLLEYISQEYLVDLIDASKSTQINLSQYKVVGFASGIYFGKFHKSVVDTARKCLPDGVPVFFIYTYGSKQKNQTRAIAAAVSEHSCPIWGEYGCRGYDTFGPFKMIGGLNKDHPDGMDLHQALLFYETIIRHEVG